MTNDKRRAEIEYLIACELDKPSVYMDGPTKASQRKAKAIMQILDRVHDARDDDEAERLRAVVKRWEERFDNWQTWRMYEVMSAAEREAARSPQTEDHE